MSGQSCIGNYCKFIQIHVHVCVTRILIFHFIIPCLACYELAAKVYLGIDFVNFNQIFTDPGSVGDIRGSCTAEYGKHQVPFAFELYLDQ